MSSIAPCAASSSSLWAPRRASTKPAAPAAPQLVDGRYEVLRPVARGSLGEVHEARHRTTRRAVVVKIGRADPTHLEESRRRLRREARALGAMQHAGIPAILDAGQCPEAGPYIVTEKMEGRSVEGLLAARGRLEVPGAVHVMRAVAEALAEVHRRGFVHRDVKPANTFVAQLRPGVEAVKLIDFGVVGVLGAPPSEAITQLGAVLGTPGYMAPEQLADASSADARADLYSLGLLALECLGVPPDRGPQRRRVQHLASTTLASRGDVPPGLIALLDDLTCPDADRRPRDADHVIARLEALFGPPQGVVLLGYGGAAAPGHAPPIVPPPPLARPQTAPGGHEAPPRPRTRPALAPAPAPALGEQRSKPRAPYVTPARLLHDRGVVDGRTEDVSEGGLLLVTPGDTEAIHGATHIRFSLPTTGKVVTLPVHVRWKREQPGRNAVGLEFYPVSAEVREAIGVYVKWLCDGR